MTSNNKKINALRKGVGRLTAALNERWAIIQAFPEYSTANSTLDAIWVIRAETRICALGLIRMEIIAVS